MPENQSDACRYLSRFGGYITPSNYIVEEICQRIALKDKLGSLPVKFWNLAKWKKIYMQQLLLANSLLKLYKPAAIISALRKHPKVYSLRAEWLDDTFKDEQEKLDNQAKLDQERQVEKAPVEPFPAQLEPTAPRPAFSPDKSLKSKLRDLD